MSRVIEVILHLRGGAAYALIFLLPALESSAFVGFLFPGELAVVLGGVLAYQGRVSLPWVAAVLEAFGGLLIVVGLWVSFVAFILCGEMAVAYFMVHFPRGFWPIQNEGELAVLYCFIFLYLCAAGAGGWSLDRLIRKKGT